MIRLNMAGVPRQMVTHIATGAQHFWDNVIVDDEPEPYIMAPDMQPWTVTSALLADYLGTNSPFRRWRIERAFTKEVESSAPPREQSVA